MPAPLARVVVVSDLHIGPDGPLNNFHAGAELAELVRSLVGAEGALVIAGDFFDCLQVPSRPGVLDLEGAPTLLRRLLDEVRGTPWGAALFAALGDFVRAGGLWVVLPGNHDPELYHPEARRLLSEAAGLGASAPGVILHNAADPWRAQVGRWQVVVGHGHLGDPWNRIAPAAIHQALSRGEPSLPFPPGSLLVLETINAFKRACEPVSGAPRFPFVDLLKPEGPWVPLLLLAFDPGLALSHLPGVGGHGGQALLRALVGRLRSGTKLEAAPGAEEEQEREGPEAARLNVADELAQAIAAALTPGERQASRALLARVESGFAGVTPSRPGALGGAGSATALLLRAAHRLWHDGGGFYDPGAMSVLDRGIVAEHLREGTGPRVVVAGHTHAAREAHLPKERIYLNTGTWTDLLQVPEEGDAETLSAWAEALRGGRAMRLQRLTYGDITPDEISLRSWPSGDPLYRGESAR